MKPAVLGYAAVMVCVACGATGPELLSVAGTYATAPTVLNSTCGFVGVEARPTIVGHSPGGANIVLEHAGGRYSGTIDSTATFTTEPEFVNQNTITITGSFSERGFTAVVGIDVIRVGQPACQYEVEWIGTKDGPRNVIP